MTDVIYITELPKFNHTSSYFLKNHIILYEQMCSIQCIDTNHLILWVVRSNGRFIVEMNNIYHT